MREMERELDEYRTKVEALEHQNKKLKAQLDENKLVRPDPKEKPEASPEDRPEASPNPEEKPEIHPKSKLRAKFAAQVSDAKKGIGGEEGHKLSQMLDNLKFGLQSACFKALSLNFTSILTCHTCGMHLPSAQGYCRHRCGKDVTLPQEFLNF